MGSKLKTGSGLSLGSGLGLGLGNGHAYAATGTILGPLGIAALAVGGAVLVVMGIKKLTGSKKEKESEAKSLIGDTK